MLRVIDCFDLKELFIEDAPNLQRLLGSSLARKECVKIVSAPKLEMLGILTMKIRRIEVGTSVFEVLLISCSFISAVGVHKILNVRFHKRHFFTSADVERENGCQLEYSGA